MLKADFNEILKNYSSEFYNKVLEAVKRSVLYILKHVVKLLINYYVINISKSTI